MATISVLGVDLGKNVCSVVGLDGVRRGRHAAEGEARDADRAGGEASSLRCRRWRPAAAPIISAASSPPTATTCG